VLDVQSYVRLRRNNSAVLNCFGLIEYAHGTDLPDEVYEDSIFRQLLDAACDLVCWTNVRRFHRSDNSLSLTPLRQDVYSYDMEQAKGHHGNNIVTVLMKEKKIGLQDAVDYIGEYCQELMNDFLVAKASIGSFGPSIDAQMHRFIHGLECWIVGNLK